MDGRFDYIVRAASSDYWIIQHYLLINRKAFFGVKKKLHRKKHKLSGLFVDFGIVCGEH